MVCSFSLEQKSAMWIFRTCKAACLFMRSYYSARSSLYPLLSPRWDVCERERTKDLFLHSVTTHNPVLGGARCRWQIYIISTQSPTPHLVYAWVAKNLCVSLCYCSRALFSFYYSWQPFCWLILAVQREGRNSNYFVNFRILRYVHNP